MGGSSADLMVFAQGEDETETRFALKDSLILYFIEHHKRGSMPGDGWVPVTGSISQEKNDYVEYLDIPVYLERVAA